jgi:proteasome lid subunit RPN8/RPN11
MMPKRVLIHREVLDSLLAYARMSHPAEAIALLRGSVKKGVVIVRELVIPPGALHGETFSAFQPSLLPLDMSVVGSAHSHPSSDPTPSTQDLLNFVGAIGIIVAYPYEGPSNIMAYDSRGKALEVEVVE